MLVVVVDATVFTEVMILGVLGAAGGGNGGSFTVAATDAMPNTGSGGSGSGTNGPFKIAGSGGSGIVIIAVPN